MLQNLQVNVLAHRMKGYRFGISREVDEKRGYDKLEDIQRARTKICG